MRRDVVYALVIAAVLAVMSWMLAVVWLGVFTAAAVYKLQKTKKR